MIGTKRTSQEYSIVINPLCPLPPCEFRKIMAPTSTRYFFTTFYSSHFSVPTIIFESQAQSAVVHCTTFGICVSQYFSNIWFFFSKSVETLHEKVEKNFRGYWRKCDAGSI